MKFKYWKQDEDGLLHSQVHWLSRIHSLARDHGLLRTGVRDYRFTDPNARLMYEVMLSKLDSRISSYKERSDLIRWQEAPNRKDRAWKTFWKRKRDTIDWNRSKFKSPARYYLWRKAQFKDRFYDKPRIYIDSRGLHNYKLDPYDFKKKRLYNYRTNTYDY